MTVDEPALSESKGVLKRNAVYGLFTNPSIMEGSYIERGCRSRMFIW
jgi:hypothetical protein